jgi:hypothetical protein
VSLAVLHLHERICPLADNYNRDTLLEWHNGLLYGKVDTESTVSTPTGVSSKSLNHQIIMY